jgi:hypothetical protein
MYAAQEARPTYHGGGADATAPPKFEEVSVVMSLRPITIRFDDHVHELISAEAKRMGVSFAQFVREAALLRTFMRALAAESDRPPDRAWVQDFSRLSEEVVRLSKIGG